MVKNSVRADRGESGLSSPGAGEAASGECAAQFSAETWTPIIDASWDPYQVWLTRVKQPREQSARTRRQARAVAEQPSAPDLSDTARLRTLTITR